MTLKAILAAMMAVFLALPSWAQQPAATGGSSQSKDEATFWALAPLVAPHTSALSAAGVVRVVARIGKQRRDIQVFTQWGPAYFAWPKAVTPVTFDIYVKAPNAFDVIAEDYTDADRARFAAAFDAVLPQAVRSANATRSRSLHPRP